MFLSLKIDVIFLNLFFCGEKIKIYFKKTEIQNFMSNPSTNVAIKFYDKS